MRVSTPSVAWRSADPTCAPSASPPPRPSPPPPSRRARELQLRRYDPPRPEATLLVARILCATGDLPGARELLAWLDARQPAADAQPSQRTLRHLVALLCAPDFVPAAWDALCAD